VKNCTKILIVALMACLAVSACKKKDEQKTVMPPTSLIQQQDAAVVIVPDTIKGKWKSVTLTVLDKNSGKTADYEVAIGSKVSIPESDMAIQVLYFMPDFVMFGNKRTSKSNEPKNPAAQVLITEGGKEIYKNWLFTALKTPHAFQHPRYDVSLKGFTPAGS
jgi:hypothetical protein